jgi:ABC-type transporter Mla subunit MlaD
MEQTVAEEVDLRFLGEQIKRLQGDVRLFVNSHFGRLSSRIDAQSDQIKSIFDQLKAQSDQIRSIFDQLKEQSDHRNARSGQFDAILSEIRSLKRS